MGGILICAGQDFWGVAEEEGLAAVKVTEIASWHAPEEGAKMPEVCKVFPFVGLREGGKAEELGGGSDNKEDGSPGGMCI